MNLRLALIISLIAGFVSISMEIVWFSILGYVFKGHAFTFGAVLSLILFGIAFGAKYGYRSVKNPDTNVLQLISKYLLYAAIINFLGFPVIAWLMTIHSAFGALLAVNVVTVSGLLGCIFPLLCHIAVSTDEQKVGKQTSLLYAANIIGATSGPLITGYVLYDYFSPEAIISGLCIVLLLLGMILRLLSERGKTNLKYAGIFMLLIIGVTISHKTVYTNYLARLQYQTIFGDDKIFKHVFHNRSGTITVDQEDRFFGSGAYDGAINTDPWVFNINAIDRAYMISALHRSPERVLMIGLSSGSWAKVISDYPLVKEITIVEINPGYLELIKNYPEISPILTDKRIKIIIDDGRRWLKNNPEEKYDLIVMNTTYYWRQNSTNLYSFEYLSMAKTHLNKNGVLYWNTTKCADEIYTAAHVFNHVVRYGTFVAGSDSPFDLSYEEKAANLILFRRQGKVLFTQDKFKNTYNELLAVPIKDVHDSILQEDLWLITDNNMAGEYKSDIWRIFSSITSSGSSAK